MDRTPSFIVQYFGDYILLDRIAVGGMAEIFRAKQSGARGFEKIVVIKKILQHLGDDPEFVSMFEDEAKIAAQLNQANIVQIYELGEVNENLYIVMEYVEGKNLRDVIRALSTKNLQLSIPQTVFIVSEILKGLDYAHRKTDSQGRALEIVHRDMSPQNVIVSYEGEVKILDFGIAKASSKLSKTEVGVLKGKFSYMSPEQASGRLISQSTDLYAVGVMLHEMLTGQRLFRADTDMETLERVRQAIVPKPSEKNASIPQELDQIVLKALQRDESKRFVNAGEFLGALTEFSFNHKMSYNSQGMASFLKTLFASNIEKERQALQRSLKEKPLEDQSVAKNIKTHIAFKSPQLQSSE
ncbi:MAG: serine/threonine protein kinase, partial [Bdellovibrionota bacterium]